MSKRIPQINEEIWGDIANNFLTQSLDPAYGHINLWNDSTRRSGTTLAYEDFGFIGWNTERGCWEIWEGSSWRRLYAKLENFDDIEAMMLETILNNTTEPAWFNNSFIEAYNQKAHWTLSGSTLRPRGGTISTLDLDAITVLVKTPTANSHAVNKLYVDNLFDTVPDWFNDKVNELFSINDHWTLNLDTRELDPKRNLIDTIDLRNVDVYVDSPTHNSHPASKQYVDNKFNNIQIPTHEHPYDLNELKDLLGSWIDGLIQNAISGIPSPSPSPSPTPPSPSPSPTPAPVTGSLTIEQIANTIESRSIASGVYIASAEMRVNGSINSSTQPVRFVLSNYYSPPGTWVPASGKISTALPLTATGSFSLNARIDIAAKTSARAPGEGKYLYMFKGTNTSVFNFNSSETWTSFMQNYYLDHVEIPYGGFRTSEWTTFLQNSHPEVREYFS